MKLNKIGMTALLLILATSCSSANRNEERSTKKVSVSPTARAVTESNGEYYAVLDFNKGTRELSETSKRDLREFVASAQKDGRIIDDIKILSWADKEYPKNGASLSGRDVRMANERSKSIEKYLKDDLKADANYATYNMAKRPNKVSEFFRADDYKTKRIFEKSGSTSDGNNFEDFVTSKAGKSLIMVDYE